MPRIAGVDIPRNKQIWVSLQYIYGIGRSLSLRIAEKAGVDPTIRLKDLAEDDLNHLRETIDREFRVEGDLRKEVNLNIKRLRYVPIKPPNPASAYALDWGRCS